MNLLTHILLPITDNQDRQAGRQTIQRNQTTGNRSSTTTGSRLCALCCICTSKMTQQDIILQTVSEVSPPTSRVKDSTTSDLDSAFSSSWPMSMMEVLWPRFSFCSLNSPPLDTGMLSRFAIRRLTEDRSSSMYMASISLETNRGNFPPY